MQLGTCNDTASIGYYRTNLANGARAEMSARMHAGVMQYTFPSDSGQYVLVDLSHYLPTTDEPIASQYYSDGQISLSADGRMYSGSVTFRGGWNEGKSP